MKAKLKILSLTSLASVTLLAGLAAISLSNGGSFGMRADDNSERSFVVTAEMIRAALGEDGSATSRKSGTFNTNGMDFAISNAYYANGKINVSGGSLYNVTLAGQNIGTGLVGTGFKKMVVSGYDAKATSTASFKDKWGISLDSKEIGAVTADQTIEYTGSEVAARCEISFGEATEGTSFSSITYTYTCGTTPSENLTELTDAVVQHYPTRDSGTTIPQMWSLVKESEAAKAAGWLKFSFTVSQDFEAIHFIEANGWGSADSGSVKNCTTIWSSGYSGVDIASWDGGDPLVSTSGAGVDTLRITDEAGNPLGKLGESGIDFKVGKTYNVYYNLDSSKILMIWLSSWSQTGAAYSTSERAHGHGYEVYYWKASQYYLEVANYVSFGSVYAVN